MPEETKNQEITFSSGYIPVLKVEGKSLPEAWEKSLLSVWENGVSIKTQYDRSIDPPSRDASMVMVVHEPLSEPRIHRALPTGLDELEIYRQEVVLGIHDHWVGNLDQIETAINNLAECFYTRRAQAITWVPGLDAKHHEPPCLQRMWFRILEDPNEGLVLNMNTHWRSRDAYKAAFMNIFALTDLQKAIAEKLSELIGKKVKTGRYADMVDSYHIYGSYFEEFKGFLNTLKTKSFEERTYSSSFAQPFFEEAREKIKAEKK